MDLKKKSGRKLLCHDGRQRRRPRTEHVVLAVTLLLVITACQGPSAGETPPPDPSTTISGSSPSPTSGSSPTNSPAPTAAAGKIGHVFVINLENQSYNKTWGPDSPAPYLSQTLRSQGVLLTQYYGVAHHSNPNYLAQISGQASNPMTRNDCTTYAPFIQTGTADPGQVLGSGCVYPASVPTIAGQLSDAGKTWKGYMEDMGRACRHPNPGAKDDSQNAKIDDQYATRHNPFVYFTSITSSPGCQNNVVDYSNLAKDLQAAATTPNLAYISPNLCHDGHDSPCVDGQPGGLESADAWLKEQVPAILNSPAYRQDGLLVITFDEADGNATGPSGLPGGTAGGLIGALVLSPFSSPGTSTATMYNHYSLLATMEDIFSVPRLGYAGAPGLRSFGRDVFNAQL
ncbi:alkaline phosphatase family protein [Arthrobacter sp. NPDC080031]|uniref:alkaline phosphatase family protein n=1 Tax=Arthrobacter sp. NPDC080031 TaxID=3155918 RepID=UPI00344D89F6